LREELAERAVEMKNQDYFEVLGVSKNASRAEIQKAYFALAKHYHPDRMSGTASAEIRNLADEIFNIISNAHDVLADDARRDNYLEELSSGTKRDVSSEVSKILSAEGLFQKGEIALRKREYEKARDMSRRGGVPCLPRLGNVPERSQERGSGADRPRSAQPGHFFKLQGG